MWHLVACFSLYGIMAHGKTAMGKRLLKVRPHHVYPLDLRLFSRS
jgi:hypothetical protein